MTAAAPTLRLDEVMHVGSLDIATRTARPSLEAFLLSVSVDPEEWGSIARCAGPIWTLRSVDARWLDAHSLDDDRLDEIEQWAIERGYAEKAEIWRAWHFDGECDDWRYFEFFDPEQAWAEVDEDEEPDEDVPSETGELVDSVQGLKLTAAGIDALERWDGATAARDGIVILWARDVLSKEMPDLVGIWWNDLFDPLSLSCPRGGIFPEKLHLFEVEDEFGNPPPAGFPRVDDSAAGLDPSP